MTSTRDISEAVERFERALHANIKAHADGDLDRYVRDQEVESARSTLLDAATKATALQGRVDGALKAARERDEIGSTVALYNVINILTRKDS